jgi:hypothetical protein
MWGGRVGQVDNLQADCQSAFPSTLDSSRLAACRYAGQALGLRLGPRGSPGPAGERSSPLFRREAFPTVETNLGYLAFSTALSYRSAREGIGYVTHPYANQRARPWEPKWKEDLWFRRR